jgi:hypothetical protein
MRLKAAKAPTVVTSIWTPRSHINIFIDGFEYLTSRDSLLTEKKPMSFTFKEKGKEERGREQRERERQGEREREG